MSPTRPKERRRQLLRPQSTNGSDESRTSSRDASCDYPGFPIEPIRLPPINPDVEAEYRKWSEREEYKPIVILIDHCAREGRVMVNGLTADQLDVWIQVAKGKECPQLLSTLYSVYLDQ